MSDFLIGECIYSSGEPALQRALAEVYASKVFCNEIRIS